MSRLMDRLSGSRAPGVFHAYANELRMALGVLYYLALSIFLLRQASSLLSLQF